ncbi:MAG TPA: hypothetical protein VMY59_02295 [Candidatus Thermoplasmatota archaeon]|nr:hypothetical protein [Candidatus Thermoplasmatota archaeon]
MNKHGREYIKQNRNEYSYFSDSEIQERMMRLGVEEKAFKIESQDDIKSIAIASLIEDNKLNILPFSFEEYLEENMVVKRSRTIISRIFSFFNKLSTA